MPPNVESTSDALHERTLLISSSTIMTGRSADVLRGTLDLLILKTVQWQPMHGWAISQQIQHVSDGLLEVNQGSLYPALQRLEERGWLESEWQRTEKNRRARYYTLTGAGRKALGDETKSWRQYVGAVEAILTTPPDPTTA